MLTHIRDAFSTLLASGRIVGLGRRQSELPEVGWVASLILACFTCLAALAVNLVDVWPGPATFHPVAALWAAAAHLTNVLAVVVLCRIGRSRGASSAAGFAWGALAWLQLPLLVIAGLVPVTMTSSLPDIAQIALGVVAIAIVVVCSMIWAWRLGRFSLRRFPMLGSTLMLVLMLAFTVFTPMQGILSKPGEPVVSVSLYDVASTYVSAWSQTASSQQTDEPVETRPRFSALDVERTLFVQFDKVRDATSAIERPQGDAPALFFVGGAGYAHQAVFRREAVAARDIVEARLSTRGRSLLLVNDRHDLNSHPLLTTATLDAALAQLGAKMRADRDVLMLYLTSHGGPGQFSISAPGLATGSLSAAALRQMLDRSGIRNRIIVISACYSGSFIEELENANTLIMTAARSDRTSFGCADANEWTYFGDAFFNHALRQTTCLVEAFAIAKSLINTWEAEKGLTDSEPQIVVGEAIREMLPIIARRGMREATSGSPPARPDPVAAAP